MGLKTKYATKEEIPEALREYAKQEEGKGTWVLDLEESDTLEALRKERFDHSSAKKQLTDTNTKLAEIQKRLEQFSQLGSPEEIQKWRETIEKAKPEPQKLEELQELLKSRTGELTKSQARLKEVEPLLAELQKKDEEHTREADRNKAKGEIHDAIKAMKGVNAEGLEHLLYLGFISGELKRNEAGEIVSSKDGMQLSDYAERHAKAYNLFLPNASGNHKPPNTPAAGADDLTKAKADYEAAKKARDSRGMQEAQLKIAAFEQAAQT